MSETKSTKVVSGALARRIVGPVVLVAMLVTAVAVGGPGAGPSTLTAGPDASSSQAQPSTTGPSANASTTPAPSTGSTSTPSASGPADGGPVSGGVPGVDFPGISMVVTPQRDGDLAVTQTVWLNEPVTSIDLAPPDFSAAGTQFVGKTRLVELGLVAEGRRIPLVSDKVTASRRLELATAASTFEISYLLRNAVVRSRPSVAGRALGALRPVVVSPDPTLTVMIEVRGRSVLSMVCPDLGNAQEASCAAPTDTSYRLNDPISVDSSLLIMQLNLNRTS